MRNILQKEDRAIQHPLLIVVGQHETELLLRAAAALHERQPTSELHPVADAGHCANMDNAAEFNAIVDRFIRSNSPHR